MEKEKKHNRKYRTTALTIITCNGISMQTQPSALYATQVQQEQIPVYHLIRYLALIQLGSCGHTDGFCTFQAHAPGFHKGGVGTLQLPRGRYIVRTKGLGVVSASASTLE